MAYLEARKRRDPVAIPVLSTLVSEASMVGKNDGNREPTDGEVFTTIKKMVKNTHETLAVARNEEQKKQLVAEIAVLSAFLPRQFSKDELSAELDILIAEQRASSMKDMGRVMKVLKEKYDGAYDGNVASTLVKQKLTPTV